ncbi:histidine kinase [Modestobacter sp. NPDC049651]|uniref:sensor histidine kinase n=1 Tax=unclassified Modestobacter TaxID=2643866 RepID=UPI00340EFFDA
MTAAPRTAAPSSPLPRRWVGGDDARPLGTSRVGWLWAAVWLVYLAVPIRAGWRDRDTVAGVVAVVALLVFAVGFAAYFAWMRVHRIRTGQLHAGPVWAMLGVMVLLLVIAAPGAGEDVVAGAVYVGVTAAMTLPGRQVLVVVGGLTAAAVVLPLVVPGWKPLGDFIPQLLLASFAAYGVGQVLKRNIELAHARAQLVDLAVTRERARLARDVHDVLGHSLTVITVKTELAGRLLEGLDPDPRLDRVRAEVTEVEQLARAALADVRATAAGTRQVSLPGELSTARRALESAGITADLPVAAEEVPAEWRELFAWVVREGVTNVVRHSGARWCGVTLTPTSVEVRDDGRGPGGSGSGGSGLAGLCARVTAAGGRLEVGTAPEGGFSLRVVTA